MNNATKRLIFLYSHPIQYFAPLMRKLSSSGDFTSVHVYYGTDKGARVSYDREFGVRFQWDIPLLEGYDYTILPNQQLLKKADHGFWSLQNWAIIGELYRQPKSYVIVHGWNYFTHLLTIITAKLLGHRVCLRGETPLNQELLKPSRQLRRRKWLLKSLFRWVDYFLYIGNQNKAFYQYYGVADKQLIFTPYCVDNDRFRQGWAAYKNSREELRRELGLPVEARIILYSGKYIAKKRPLDALRALPELRSEFPDVHLVLVGEGELRAEMEAFIQINDLSEAVTLTGFVNQQDMPKYYALADLFLMCSQQGETWGLSTNEAMNFALPVVLSDLPGSAYDLVEEGLNGYVYPTGDVAALRGGLRKLLQLSPEERSGFGQVSSDRIKRYSYDTVRQGLSQLPVLS